ncbi:MAG: MMPL family transporter [Proteobacteria bacterium]|nr:MMPL family transporter [Pseudomonadota bacterium]
MNSPGARAGLGVLLVAILAWVATGLELTNDLGRLLPKDGDLPAALEAIERFQVADTLLIEVDGTGVERAELLAATDTLGESLRQHEALGEVRYRVEVDDGIALQKAVEPHAIALIPAEQLEERLSPDGLRAALSSQMARLYGPGGSMFEARIVADPIDLSGLALAHIRSKTGPFAMKVESGHFLDRAGERAIILVEPTVPALGMGPEHPLIVDLTAALDDCALPARYLGGHRMASDAATLIQEDVQLATKLGAVLLVMLFLIGFRSFRPIGGALTVSLAAAAAASATAAMLSPIHGVSLGFAAALLGLAVDYWVHLYVAASARPATTFAERLVAAREALAEIKTALLLGAGSTAGACAVLLLSRYPVVQDLGAMGIAAASGALAGTFLLGPVVYAALGSKPLPHLPNTLIPRGLGALVIVATVAGLALATGSTFNGDPRDLTPARPETRALEGELSARYGGFGTGGMVALSGETEGAVRDAAVVVQAALDPLPGVDAVGPAALLPGPETLALRRASLPPIDELQARLDDAAAEVGFAPAVVAGLAERLHQPEPELTVDTWDGTPLASLASGHVEGTGIMLSVVLADDALGDTVEATVRSTWPEAQFVMPGRFASQGVEDIVDELVRLGGLALLGVAVMLTVRYRDPRKVLAAILPCLVAVVWALGGMALFSIAWNAVSACGMVLIVGLGLDYGVFMVEDSQRDDGHAGYAVLMSSLTTAVGFGILAVTRSPALQGVGVAVLLGVLSALAAALTLTPRIARAEPLAGPFLTRWGRRTAIAALVLVNLDMLAQQLFYLSPPPSGTVPTHEVVVTPTDRSFGPNRLVQRDGMWVQYTEGTPYARGYAAAMMAPDLRQRLEDQTLVAFAESVPSPVGQYLILRATAIWAPRLDQFFRPSYLAELRGSTDASSDHFALLGPAFTRKVYYHAIHDVGQAFADSPFVVGCTGFMAGPGSTQDDHWILGRNFDFDGGPIFDRDKIVSFVQPDDGYAFVSVSFTGFVGVVSGMNSERLTVAINAAGSDDPPVAGTPMTLIVREILETASSLDEAEAILRDRKGFVSENVMVVDGEAGEAALFEVSPSKLARIAVEDDLGIANHFRDKLYDLDEQNQWRQDEITTVHRQQRMDELLDQHRGSIDLATGVAILRDRKGAGDRELPPGHRHAIDADIATHSVLFDATTGEVWVSRYPNASGGYLAFSLEGGLAGQLDPTWAVEPGEVRRTLDIHRGRALLHEGTVEAAEQARLLMPGHPQPLLALGRLHAAAGDCEQAVPLLDEALAIPPEYPKQVREAEEALATCP